jgi:tetratricopeptide (TPR) repeat protein
MAVFLATLVFTLATAVESEFRSPTASASDEGAFTKLLGDGRRLFSGQSIEMADVYLHSGFYPSIFDSREPAAAKAIASNDDDHASHKHDEQGKCVHEEDHAAHQHDAAGKCVSEASADGHVDEHEKAMSFMDQTLDPLQAFIRNFRITQHSHLNEGEEREVLPWLKLAIALDPQAVETYAVTSYWLRKTLKRVEDARDILREGIRNNPKSFELLFAMGLIYEQNDKNDEKARNIWLAAKRFWEQQSSEAKEASLDHYGKITINLARLENKAGNLPLAIKYFELTKLTSPNPAAIQKQIDEIRSRMSGATNAPAGELTP